MGSLFSPPTPPDAKLPKLTGPGEIITARDRQRMADLRRKGRRTTILTAGLAPGAEGGPAEPPAAPPEPEEVRLSAPIGSVLTNDPRDLLSVARALDAVDPVYPLHPGITSEPPQFLTRELEDRIRKFQRANGLTADGALFTGDKTELALNMALAQKRRLQGAASPNPPPPGAGVAQQDPQTPAQKPAQPPAAKPAAGSAQQTVKQPPQQPSAPPFKLTIPKGGKIRNDSMGLGHFGAPRGNRTHAGVDITVTPGQPVPSPIDGEIVKKGIVYAGDNRLLSTHIKGTGKYAGFEVIIFYVNNGQLPLNGNVKAGDPLGPAQDVRVKHGISMQTHVHYQLYKNGKLIDPTGMLP